MQRKRCAALAKLVCSWLILVAASSASAVELETLLLEGDPIPGSDETFVKIEGAWAAQDGIAIFAGVDLAPRSVCVGYAGCQDSFMDGIWILNGDRKTVQLVPFPGQPLVSYNAYEVNRRPSLFDSEGRVSVSAYFGDDITYSHAWRAKPGESPDLEIKAGDPLDSGTRSIASISQFGRLRDAGLFWVWGWPGSRRGEYFVGDPRGAGHGLLDPTLPLAPGTAVRPSRTPSFFQRDSTSVFVFANDTVTLPNGNSALGEAVAHLDEQLIPRLLVQTGDSLPASSPRYPGTFGSFRGAWAGRPGELILNWSGLWRVDAQGNFAGIAYDGDAAPGTTTAFWRSVLWRIGANEHGQIAFTGYLEGSSNPDGIWVANPDGTVELRVRRGQMQGDIQVDPYFNSVSPKILGDGSVTFRNSISAAGGVVDDSILLVAADGVLHRVVTVGQSLEVRSGDTRVVERIGEVGEFDDGLVLRIEFADTTMGLFLAKGPKPELECEPEWSNRWHPHEPGQLARWRRGHRHAHRIDACRPSGEQGHQHGRD